MTTGDTSTAVSANPLLTAALAYAARGWPVYPANPRTKVPLVANDVDAAGVKIPKTGGLAKATTDAAQIAEWWTTWPKAMIRVALGPAAGVFAIDFDPRVDPDTGEIWTVPELIAETEALIGVPLPATTSARSPSGGEHWFYRWPATGPAITGAAVLPQHVDVLGFGGSCTLAPSVRFDGDYRWVRDIDALVDAPAELLAVLQRPKPAALVPRQRPDRGAVDVDVAAAVETYVLRGLQAECRAVETAGSGSRNAQLNRSAFAVAGLAAAMLSNGATVVSAAMARAMLTDAAKGNPGRDDLAQIEATIDSGWTSGWASPRDLAKIEDEARERLARSSGRQRGSAGHAGAQRPRDAAPTGASSSSSPAGEPSPSPSPPAPGEVGKKKSSQMGGSRLPPLQRGAGECDDAGIMRPQTDLGNAERWLMRHGHAFRWCPTLGWLAWDGRRWSRDDADMLLAESIYATVRSIQDEAEATAAAGVAWREGRWPDWVADLEERALAKGAAFDADKFVFDPAHLFDAGLADDALIPNPDPWVRTPKSGDWKRRSDMHRAWGRSSEGERAIKAIGKLIVPYVTIRLDCFDADPMRLNVANGTLVFSRSTPVDAIIGTVELVPHDPADLMTMIADVEYDPEALCPLYDAFLAKVQPDPGIREFLGAWAGYSMTGDVSEQKLVINHGALGANGKGTWINTIAHVLGDYAISVPIEVFLDNGRTRNAGAPSPDLAELPRRRLLRTAEPPKNVPFAEALIKLATGEDPIRARHLNLGFFEYLPEFKMTVTMNPTPKLSDDPAVWRRIRIVPWLVSMTNDPARDPDLPRKLRAEASGVLNRMIEGLVRWLEAGLPEVAAITEATASQRATADPLSQFLSLATLAGPKLRCGSTEFHKVFSAWGLWSGSIGEKGWSQTYLAKAMIAKGFDKIQSNTMWFTGLELTKRADDFVNPVSGKPWTDLGGDDPGKYDDDDPGPMPPDMGR